MTAVRAQIKPLSIAYERPPKFSDEALALQFAAKHQETLRYVAAWGRWLRWNGIIWKFDETLYAFDLARELCRSASMEVDKSSIGRALASAKTVAAVERLAKADQRLAATIEQWDVDPWILNTPGGIIDLRTGARRDHRREDYCTKMTSIAPSGDAPRWLEFLRRITGGDKELVRFLQRVAGYALTGSTSAHALFFGYGTGANGKSCYVNTIANVLGDYAVIAPMETFIASNSDRHPTDLASLRGARLVTSIETEAGRHWAESRIKSLTGGDRITARFMRQDFFTFTPQFKLLIVGNHRPQLRSIDEAIRRRMHLIPFTVTIPEEERDEKLPERLRAEWPGILQWMIDGCLDWTGEGLAPPEAVRSATADYMADEDALALWMEERCLTGSSYYATVVPLFADWKAWADRAGEAAWSQKRFSQELQKRGLAPRRQSGTGRAGFAGVTLRPDYAAVDEHGGLL